MKRLLAAIVSIMMWAGSVHADSLTYHNDRFDVHGTVPIGFIAEPPPENGDGREFRSQNDSGILLIYGSFNWADTLAAYRADFKSFYTSRGAEVTYEAGREDWFVLSGLDQGRIFYARVVMGTNCDGDTVLAHWIIDYDPADRATYDRDLGWMSKGLKAGSC